MNDMQQTYDDQGFVGPLEAFDRSEMLALSKAVRDELDRHPELTGRRNRHLDWEVAKKLSTNEAIVNAIVQILGTDIVLWRSNIFSVPGALGLPWHQDEYHTLLSDPFSHTSVHLAITESGPDNCLMILPGSHRYRPETMEQHGLKLIPGSKEYPALGTPRYQRLPRRSSKPVQVTLKPGQFLIFHPSTVHGSRDNLYRSPGSPALMVDSIRNRIRHFRARRAAKPDRLAIGLRAMAPQNKALPAAFSETLPRVDQCVLLHGTNKNGVNEIADWTP